MGLFDHDEEKLLRKILYHLESIERFLRSARGLQISQLGERMGTINGVQAGATGTFQVTPTPAGSQLQAGNIPQWTVDNAGIVLTTSADGLTVQAAVPKDITSNTFNLSVSAVSLDGTALSQSVAVPVTGIAPPPVPATGLDISQIS